MLRNVSRHGRLEERTLTVGDRARLPLTYLGADETYPHPWEVVSFTRDGLANIRRVADGIEKTIAPSWFTMYQSEATAYRPEPATRETMSEFRRRCPATATRISGHHFFVSVQHAGRSGFLLGPYETHDEARENVTRASSLAGKADARATWYAFGTCSAPAGMIPTTVFGR